MMMFFVTFAFQIKEERVIRVKGRDSNPAHDPKIMSMLNTVDLSNAKVTRDNLLNNPQLRLRKTFLTLIP